MFLGVGLGYFFPSVVTLLDKLSVGTTSLPIAVGLNIHDVPPAGKSEIRRNWPRV